MNVREQLGSAIGASDLRMHETEERPIDRIAAAAFSRALGSRLQRLKYGGDRSCFEPAMRELVLVVRGRVHAKSARVRSEVEPLIERLVVRAMHEWVGDSCERCHGRGWVHRHTHGARRQCRSCAGTGRLRPLVTDRALAIGMEVDRYGKHWDAWIDSILWLLESADAQAAGVLRSQLERSSVRSVNQEQARSPQSATPRPTVEKNNMVARLVGVVRPDFPESPQASAAGFVVSGA